MTPGLAQIGIVIKKLADFFSVQIVHCNSSLFEIVANQFGQGVL